MLGILMRIIYVEGLEERKGTKTGGETYFEKLIILNARPCIGTMVKHNSCNQHELMVFQMQSNLFLAQYT